MILSSQTDTRGAVRGNRPDAQALVPAREHECGSPREYAEARANPYGQDRREPIGETAAITNDQPPRPRPGLRPGFSFASARVNSSSRAETPQSATREKSGRRAGDFWWSIKATGSIRPYRFGRRVVDDTLRPLPDLLSDTSRSCSRALRSWFRPARNRTREMTATARMWRWGSSLVFWNRVPGVIGGP
jgi:hypothetical protein